MGIAVVGRKTEAAVAIAEQAGGRAITADLASKLKSSASYRRLRHDSALLTCSVRMPGFRRWAAQALIPAMAARGGGYFLNIASAGGLLMTPGAVPYTVTKHAAVALAESLAMLYRGSGVRFSCLCPAVVETPLISKIDDGPVGRAVRAISRALQPDAVADIVVDCLHREQFLILSHPENQQMAVGRATDPEAYLERVSDLWSAVSGRGGQLE